MLHLQLNSTRRSGRLTCPGHLERAAAGTIIIPHLTWLTCCVCYCRYRRAMSWSTWIPLIGERLGQDHVNYDQHGQAANLALYVTRRMKHRSHLQIMILGFTSCGRRAADDKGDEKARRGISRGDNQSVLALGLSRVRVLGRRSC